jgi:hypothetical protein
MKRLIDSFYKAVWLPHRKIDCDMSEDWQGWDAWVNIPTVAK